MYLIVLSEQLKIAVKTSSAAKAILIAELDYPNDATDIFPAGESKPFTRYGRLDLMVMLRNHGVEPAGISEFGKLCSQIVEVAEGLVEDTRTLFQLEQKAGPKSLPGDRRAIEQKPVTQPLSAPCLNPNAGPKGEQLSSRGAASGPRAAPTKGATGRVWEIADGLLAEEGGQTNNLKALRSKVIAACEAEGLNPGTAATQFGKWKGTKGF